MTTTCKSLEITRINSLPELAPHLAGWRRLAAGLPMHTPEWLLGWWDAFGAPDDELWVLLLHEPDHELIGLAPLYLQNKGRRGRLRILGVAESCSHHPSWLSRPGWEQRVGGEVGRFLCACRSSWDSLLFESVDADTRDIQATMEYLAEHGALTHRRQINSCWKIHLPTTWEDYLMLLSKSLRKQCRKLQRQFFDSGKIQLRLVETEADLQQGVEIMLKLHAIRWGTRRKPLGVFDDERFRAFHETVCRDMLSQGKLRLAWLECAGKPLAIEYQLVDGKTVFAYQAGADLELSEYSPGKLTMMAAIQFALDNGCTVFDLLCGDEPYKANWRAVPSPCYELRGWRKNGRGRLEWMSWNAYTRAADQLKTVLPDRLIRQGLNLIQTIKNPFS